MSVQRMNGKKEEEKMGCQLFLFYKIPFFFFLSFFAPFILLHLLRGITKKKERNYILREIFKFLNKRKEFWQLSLCFMHTHTHTHKRRSKVVKRKLRKKSDFFSFFFNVYKVLMCSCKPIVIKSKCIHHGKYDRKKKTISIFT